MHLAAIQHHYSNLKPSSLKVDVDILWNNVLPLYLNIRKGYGIEPQQRPYQGVVKTKSDFIITAVRNGQPKKVVLVEDKRVGHERSAAMREEAVEQVTDYMKVARTCNLSVFRKFEIMYAIVTVGRYSRFYELLPGEQELTGLRQDRRQGLRVQKGRVVDRRDPPRCRAENVSLTRIFGKARTQMITVKDCGPQSKVTGGIRGILICHGMEAPHRIGVVFEKRLSFHTPKLDILPSSLCVLCTTKSAATTAT